jgi:3-methyladenine DNA glycosylase AlkC
MPENFQVRDVFNPTVVNTLAEAIHRTWPAFDKTGFVEAINPQLAALTFSQRNALLRDALHDYLPQHFPDAVQILINSLGPEMDGEELTGYDGFMVMPQCDFVAMYGLDYYDLSLQALFEMTKRFSAEGAIRAFIIRYPEKTMSQLEAWSRHENCHVRRLVSEGTRPRLPWAQRLPQFIDDPRPVLKLLNNLKTDPTLLVRRSVANNLNDIAKDNPHLVIETLREWQKIDDEGTQWLIRHAARTLLKQGNKEALALLGYPPQSAITAQNLRLENPVINMGEDLVFSFNIQSQADAPQNLMVDYVIHFMKANGKLAPKVFKLTKKQIAPGETLTISKKHPIKPITTRVYYAGRHQLAIQINGEIGGKVDFELII